MDLPSSWQITMHWSLTLRVPHKLDVSETSHKGTSCLIHINHLGQGMVTGCCWADGVLSIHQFITQHKSKCCLTTAALQHGTLDYIELRSSVKLGCGTLPHPNILVIASLVLNSSGYTQRGYVKRIGGSIPNLRKHPPSYTCCNSNLVFTNH